MSGRVSSQDDQEEAASLPHPSEPPSLRSRLALRRCLSSISRRSPEPLLFTVGNQPGSSPLVSDIRTIILQRIPEQQRSLMYPCTSSGSRTQNTKFHVQIIHAGIRIFLSQHDDIKRT